MEWSFSSGKGPSGDSNADVAAANKDGMTAVHVACAAGHAEVVDELIRRTQALAKQGTPSGVTALHLRRSLAICKLWICF